MAYNRVLVVELPDLTEIQIEEDRSERNHVGDKIFVNQVLDDGTIIQQEGTVIDIHNYEDYR